MVRCPPRFSHRQARWSHTHAHARRTHTRTRAARTRASKGLLTIGSLSSFASCVRYVRRMGAIGVGANIALGYATELLHLPLVYPLATIVTRRATTLPSSKLEAGVAVAACPRRVWGRVTMRGSSDIERVRLEADQTLQIPAPAATRLRACRWSKATQTWARLAWLARSIAMGVTPLPPLTPGGLTLAAVPPLMCCCCCCFFVVMLKTH